MSWENIIPDSVKELYEIHDYKHAAAILCKEFHQEFLELCEALMAFRFSEEDITKEGGNESNIPKKFSEILRPKGWKAQKLDVSNVTKLTEKDIDGKEVIKENEISNPSTHIIDYVKGRIAFDLEWNSKDQTFDRDLYAFKAFYDYNIISLGVLVTRSNDLDSYFTSLGEYDDKNGIHRKYKDKYGASTTHMGKLLPRLDGGRNGGCPVLVFGITQKLLSE